MRCEICRGACCESFSMPRADLRPPGPDEWRWLELHATSRGASLEFECRCTKLTPAGRCSIYSDRPEVCRTFMPGGPDCLEMVRNRRTPEQYAAIREPQDPERIHQ